MDFKTYTATIQHLHEQRHDALILGASTVAGYLVVDQLMEPQQKEKLRKAIGAN